MHMGIYVPIVYLGSDPRKLQKSKGTWEGKEGNQPRADGDNRGPVLLWPSEDHAEHTSDCPTWGLEQAGLFTLHLPFVWGEWLAYVLQLSLTLHSGELTPAARESWRAEG